MKTIVFALFLLPFTSLAQKRNDNQIILSTPDSASIVYRNLFQYLMQHGYEVINKDDKNYLITVKKIDEVNSATEMKINVKVQRTDSTRAYITGMYKGDAGGNTAEKNIIYTAAPSTLMGNMWTNMAQLVEVQPNAKIKYSKK